MKSIQSRTVARLAVLFAALWMAATSTQASPPYVNYQGTISDTAGAPISNPTQAFEFNIYDAATAGAKVWGPFTVTAPVLNGRFNVILGPTDTATPARSIDTVFSNSDSRYLEIKVGTTVIAPRQRFLGNPYAFAASSVSNGKFELTPDSFKIKDKNVLEVGSGLGQLAGNATLSAQKQGTAGLEIVGGGATEAARLTTVYGKLNIVNSGSGLGNLSVSGNAEILGSLIDKNGKSVDLTAVFAEIYPLPRVIYIDRRADTVNWHPIEVDLGPYIDDEDGCRVDFKMMHKTVGDLVDAREVYFNVERPELSNNNVAGMQVAIHGWGLAGETYPRYQHTLNTAAKVFMVQCNGDYFRIYNYKPGFAFGQNNVDGPTYTGADKFKVCILFNPLVQGKIIVRNH